MKGKNKKMNICEYIADLLQNVIKHRPHLIIYRYRINIRLQSQSQKYVDWPNPKTITNAMHDAIDK